MDEEDLENITSSVRTLKHDAENQAQRVQVIVDQIVSSYNKQLDDFIDSISNRIEKTDALTDDEVETLVLKVPIFMYYGVSGLEKIGVQLDTAKSNQSISFNNYYMRADGTISDKTAKAQNETIPESLLVTCYERAYKQLKAKMEVAEQLCNSTRKILQKRITELDIHRMERTGEISDNK